MTYFRSLIFQPLLPGQAFFNRLAAITTRYDDAEVCQFIFSKHVSFLNRFFKPHMARPSGASFFIVPYSH
jgi:hypothetical protein